MKKVQLFIRIMIITYLIIFGIIDFISLSVVGLGLSECRVEKNPFLVISYAIGMPVCIALICASVFAVVLLIAFTIMWIVKGKLDF